MNHEDLTAFRRAIATSLGSHAWRFDPLIRQLRGEIRDTRTKASHATDEATRQELHTIAVDLEYQLRRMYPAPFGPRISRHWQPGLKGTMPDERLVPRNV